MKQKCKCWDMGLRENMTCEELLEEVYRPERMCTGGQFVCPTVDAEWSRARAERDRREGYAKRTGKDGQSISRRAKRGPKAYTKKFTPSFD